MIRNSVCLALLLFLQNGKSFETHYADSIFQKTREFSDTEALNFMLDEFYGVFNMSHTDAVKWVQYCVEYSIQLGNERLIGRSYLNLGMSLYMSGDYPGCLENYQKALSIFEKNGDKQYVGRTCNEFSVYWRKQKQYDRALEDLDRSFKMCSECHDTVCVETSLNNRAVVYEMMGNYPDAVRFYQRAEEVALAIRDSLGLAFIYADEAECYRLKEDRDSSLLLIDASIAIMEKLNNRQGVGLNLINKAAIFHENGQHQKAIETYLQCIGLGEQLGYVDLLKNAHYQLGKEYAETGDFEKSFDHIDRSYSLRDSLINEEKMRSLSEMEVKYETEKIEKDLLKEQQQRIKTELKVATRNNWLIGLGLGTFVVVFMTLFVLQRKTRLLQAQKDRAIIAERERGIQAVFDATEDERKRIAKDLHDGVGQQMSGLKLAWQNLAISATNLSENEKKTLIELSGILDSAADEVRSISHRMMPRVLEEMGLIPALEDMLEKALKFTSLTYQFDHFNLDHRLPKRTEVALFRITQELVNNIIKHAQATLVSVQLFRNQNQLILIVEDNGKGMNGEETREGHGLLNIRSRLNTIHGEVNFEASPTAGTTATIRLDLPEQYGS